LLLLITVSPFLFSVSGRKGGTVLGDFELAQTLINWRAAHKRRYEIGDTIFCRNSKGYHIECADPEAKENVHYKEWLSPTEGRKPDSFDPISP
jgi:hypothetical protein